MTSYDILASQNLWWKGREKLGDDEDYRKWETKNMSGYLILSGKLT